MKEISYNYERRWEKLYIPHGSDESTNKSFSFFDCDAFISHMVQMKAFYTFVLQSKHLSLYPTWFRWKWLTGRARADAIAFISHMVQMKDRWKKFQQILQYQLYIPHGSDESLNDSFSEFSLRSLYPTWFRWKVIRWFVIRWFQLFISHMVQMKGWGHSRMFRLYTLYIPHGSDESWDISNAYIRNPKLYIPHGSDERSQQSQNRACQALLYIPHGSDESWVSGTTHIIYSVFISHMVQMKEDKKCPKSPGRVIFISHMVQMKDEVKHHLTHARSDFISHMVQMKE